MKKGPRIRDARDKDRDTVLEFCRKTWPGYGDYIPRIWDNWIGDRSGRFIVAEIDGVPVGIAKITEFSAGEIWLEGLRVDPRHRRRGIGDIINLEVLRTVKRMKPRYIRFCTGLTNRASRQLGEKFGFEIVARLRYYWRKSRKGNIRGDLARSRDIDSLYDYIVRSRFMMLTSGLVAEGWVFREFSRELLQDYVRNRRVIMLKRFGGIRAAAIYPFEENDESLTLGFVDGDRDGIRILTRNCMYLAKHRGNQYCSVAVPTRGFARIAEDAGYVKKDSVGQVVFAFDGRDLKSMRLGKSR